MDTVARMFVFGFPWLHLLLLVWLIALGGLASGLLKSGQRKRKWFFPSLAGLALVRRIVNMPPVFSAAQARTGNCS